GDAENRVAEWSKNNNDIAEAQRQQQQWWLKPPSSSSSNISTTLSLFLDEHSIDNSKWQIQRALAAKKDGFFVWVQR
ncbi:hypothetical protein PIB30_086942, partial [Stylosanthes scabra]|nr:hypothetical protein [Stylosanthes scabra]